MSKRKTSKKIINLMVISSLVSVGVSIFKKSKALKNKYNNCYFFNGEELDYREQEFNEDSIAALFSGVDIDFTGATLKDNKAIIELYSKFSGISIIVPEHWNVKASGQDDKSGVSNEFEYNEDNTEAPLLEIKYNLKFSGLEIKKADNEEDEIIDVEQEEQDSLVEEQEEQDIEDKSNIEESNIELNSEEEEKVEDSNEQ
ncbi:MAG: cell wall-active antibiotics response protein [Vallitalea sp.]|jgi:hypothetical protein|nr:cell wall-active antibiotics response protein [Vallitalea sp.]